MSVKQRRQFLESSAYGVSAFSISGESMDMDVIKRRVRSHNVELWEIGNNSPLVNPQEKVRLLMPFPEYRDSARPYRYHCHILEHEDAGMMGQFTVV